MDKRLALAISLSALAVVGLAVVSARVLTEGDTAARAELTASCMTAPLEPGTYVYRVSSQHLGNPYEARLHCARIATAEDFRVEELAPVLASVFNANPSGTDASALCHDIAHEVGRNAYAALGSDALIPGYGDCGFGYYHGAMQYVVTQETLGEKLTELVEFCRAVASREDPGEGPTYLNYWSFCSHGVGHSVGTAGVGFEQAQEACLAMDHPNERPFSEVVQSGFSGAPLYNPGELECFAGYLNEVMLARERTGQGAQSVNDAVRECDPLEFPWSMRCVSYALN